MEPHSFNTSNFLMDHCKQLRALHPSTVMCHIHFSYYRCSLLQQRSLSLSVATSTLMFLFSIWFSCLHSFLLSALMSLANPKHVSAKHEGNTKILYTVFQTPSAFCWRDANQEGMSNNTTAECEFNKTSVTHRTKGQEEYDDGTEEMLVRNRRFLANAPTLANQ